MSEENLTNSNSNNFLLLIDGHALVFKYFYALQRMGMRTKDGIPTWAVYGFTKAIFEMIIQHKPKYLIVTFDTGHPTFREKMYPLYKANRDEAPDDFRTQMPFIIEIVKALEIPVFEMIGFEADDLLGTLSKQAAEKGLDVGIITGDQDLIQLIDDKVHIFLPQKEGGIKKFDEAEALAKYGVPPKDFIDYKAIKGDTSDNIPGVKGIGEKGAEKLIKEFNNLENIYENIDKVKPDRIKNLLLESKEMAFLSKTLSTIERNAPVTLELDKCLLNLSTKEKIEEKLKRLEFRTLVSMLPKVFSNFKSDSGENLAVKFQDEEELWFDFNEEEHGQIKLELNAQIVSTKEALEELIADLNTLEYFAIDLETDSITALKANIVGIAISHDKNIVDKKVANFHTFYIPTGHSLLGDLDKNLALDIALPLLKPILENDKIGKIGHNLKYEINVFSNYEIDLKGIKDDTFIADYLLNPANTHALKEISKGHLHYFMTPITELIGKGKTEITINNAPLEEVAKYAGADAAVTLELSFYLREKLELVSAIDLYEKMELPLVKVLSQMEQSGIKIDQAYLHTLSEKIDSLLLLSEAKIYEIAGKQFNINSPKQLNTILFEDLKLTIKGLKKNKSGGYSTDANTLEKLASQHEIVKHLLEYRQLAKIKSTYTDTITSLISEKTGKIHTSYNQTGAATGRLSSTDPNLQNIPIKTELGREIRKAFIPSNDNNVILTADYSQIELRLLAHYTKDPVFMEAFKNHLDIHARTIMDVFGLSDISMVTTEMRRIGKTVNFGIIYGQTAYGLSESLKIPVREASEIIKKFNEKYVSIDNYVKEMVAFAEKNGYAETFFKRRRYLPDIHNSNRALREFAKRNAVNSPLQGTAADLIKIAMVNVERELEKNNFKTKMLLQVHDELVFEVPQEEIEAIKLLVKTTMEGVCPEIEVPLDVSINVGNSWIEAK